MKILARLGLIIAYSVTLACCWLSRFLRKKRSCTNIRRIVVIGTFYNLGWYRSHIIPLAKSEVDEVIVVTDFKLESYEKVRFKIPPKWMVAMIGRAGAKCVSLAIVAICDRPDIYIGYHIFPGAISALAIGCLSGRPVCYQMTGGPIEIIGGGFSNENILMKNLGTHSPTVEKMALAVVGKFDMVVVRGNKAKKFLLEHCSYPLVSVIPGSVVGLEWRTYEERRYDLIFVGRLAEIKQPHQFVEIVAEIAKVFRDVKAIMVGDGPLMQYVLEHAAKLNIQNNITMAGRQGKVEPFLLDARIFVLTSRSEGLSIAMAEAMAAGCVPVVADVGELEDLVVEGNNGWLIPPNDVPEYSRKIGKLLEDRHLWKTFSVAAVAGALRYANVDAVANRWCEELNKVATHHCESLAS